MHSFINLACTGSVTLPHGELLCFLSQLSLSTCALSVLSTVFFNCIINFPKQSSISCFDLELKRNELKLIYLEYDLHVLRLQSTIVIC